MMAFSGCASWKAHERPIAPHILKHPEEVRLSLIGGEVLQLEEPRIRGDSVFGRYVAGAAPDSAVVGEEVGVSIDEVSRIDVKTSDGADKAIRTTFGLAVLIGLVVLIVHAAGNADPDFVGS